MSKKKKVIETKEVSPVVQENNPQQFYITNKLEYLKNNLSELSSFIQYFESVKTTLDSEFVKGVNGKIEGLKKEWENLQSRFKERSGVWVAGFPSFYGGADTELFHNILLLRMYDIEVHLVPMFGTDSEMKKICLEKGCFIHEYNPFVFKNQIVISFCNGQFLDKLPEIMEYGKPNKIIWFNCMTWTFEKEIEAHKKGWIDLFGFVSNYQKNYLIPQLEKYNKVNVFEGYKPYFKFEEDMFDYNPTKDSFNMGRCSRDDGNKFSSDMWNIFYKVCSPIPTKTFILGWGENSKSKCGDAPRGLDWATYSPNSMKVKDFYRKMHCIIHKTGGSRESYCRIVPECYAHGVPIIVEDDYAFPELIIDGETGFRCKTSDEMSYRASQLAFDENLRKRIIFNARDYLKEKISKKEECLESWKGILK